MARPQPGILAACPSHARWLLFDLRAGGDVRAALGVLAHMRHGDEQVSGIGTPSVDAMRMRVSGLRAFPALARGGIVVPSTQAALAVWLRGGDPGELLHRGRAFAAALAGGFTLREHVDTFVYADSRDLTGYADGTANPSGDAAIEAAITRGELAGSSFVAVQRWVHDLARFQSFGREEQDAIVGRRYSDNEEISDAPESAHVKRTAQETFSPTAFVVRRSMPWAEPEREGLWFVAFGASLDAFETLLRHMVGLDDGIADALFRFTQPVSGSYFWCPPCLDDGTLDLSALGIAP